MLLETDGLCMNFGAVVAADDITLGVSEDEVIGVIGANGAGKTTFINLVTGYLRPSAGSIRFRAREITGRSPREVTRIGIRRSFQIPQLFTGLSALDNLMIALGIAEPPRPLFWRPLATAQTRAAALRGLERVGIAAYRDHVVAALPQGVRKLLDIAMAMVGGPSLLLLDEPTSGISAEEKFDIMDTVMRALREERVTVMFVEHDMEIVERYAKRVIAFYAGQIIADGAPQAVLADANVRRFVVGTELHRRH